ncbi:MAG: hypothetical protein ACI8RD_004885 [Bacillariaceae sp.]|jgi:hypothetical protein
MHTPGLGITDFVSDVSQIVKNRSGRSRKGRKRNSRKKNSPRNNPNDTGLYYQPGTASGMSSLYSDVDDGSGGIGTRGTIDSSYDDSSKTDNDEYPIQEEMSDANPRYGDNRTVRFTNNQPTYNNGVGRQRMMSDDTDGTGENADNEDSDDLELL